MYVNDDITSSSACDMHHAAVLIAHAVLSVARNTHLAGFHRMRTHLYIKRYKTELIVSCLYFFITVIF